ncbi:MAG TPA: LacI family DNA-binding transcriptional regulator [Microbacterium sp.]|nr:LacI family DNA-binding transcriptional regulator [Microbacterium sp.]
MVASPGSGPVTVKDVAAHAGVSPMTVSRTLGGGKNVRPELQELVWKSVTALGYHRNENARSLRPGHSSGLIGVAITNLANPYYGDFAIGVEEVAARHGRRILLGNSSEDQERERQLIADFIGRQVEGLVVVPAAGGETGSAHLAAGALAGTPLVLASRLVPGIDASAVILDDQGGAEAGTRVLLDAGHTRIAYLGNLSSVFTGQRRFEGFSRAMSEAGLEVDAELVRREQQDVASARDAMAAMLRLPEPPTAVFAANNRNAIGAMTAIAAHMHTGGAPGPSVVGFDGFELAELSPVPLTLVEHDARQLGRRAAELLFAAPVSEAGVVETIPVRIREVRRDTAIVV